MGVPAKYGGFETLVENLCLHLKNDFEITVYCSGKEYNESNHSSKWNGIDRIFIPLKANGIQSIPYDLLSLINSLIRKTDIIILLGGGIGIFLPILKLFFINRKIVLHPDGYEWKRQKWNFLSKIFLCISIKTACRVANRIIIDNSALLDYYKKFKSKLHLATYGGDHLHTSHARSIKKNWLTIARAEKENKLIEIAKSFSEIKNENWTLISNFNDTKYGKQLKSFCSNYSNITLIPQIYDKKELQAYYNSCFGYIHGHSVGGTNPTLTAAMWLGKPLICHDNPFNKATTQSKASFFRDSKELKNLLITNNFNNENLLTAAKKIAKQEYKWEKVSNDYKKILSF